MTVCGGSSVDQQSNNVSLFNLVEQVNVNPNAPQPPKGMLPLEIHAYWRIDHQHVKDEFESRFVLVAETGLETPSNTYKHRPVTSRFRTRTMGLPNPPVFGDYVLRVDWRMNESDEWQREPLSWPIALRLAERKPPTTH